MITGNEKVERIALENAQRMLDVSGENKVRPDDEDVKKITEPFISRHELQLVDPLNAEKKARALKEEVEEFESEVDACLSEINAVTFIEV